jgi:hypothetical protein
MDRTTKYLRRPIEAEISGQPVTLLTIGHLAREVNRTPWTIHYWQRIGLLPQLPFFTNHPNPLYRRGVYPEPFVLRVADMFIRNGIGERLGREDWEWFRDEVFAAFQDTMESLRGDATPADAHQASA